MTCFNEIEPYLTRTLPLHNTATVLLFLQVSMLPSGKHALWVGLTEYISHDVFITLDSNSGFFLIAH